MDPSIISEEPNVQQPGESEVPRLVWGNEARDALGLLKLYVQQQ